VNSVAAGHCPKDFVEDLSGTAISSLRIAASYLAKGFGTKFPDPPLRGIDTVTTRCIREFGVLPRELRDFRLEFEEFWNSRGCVRNKLKRKYESESVPTDSPNEKDHYLKLWMRDAKALVKNQLSSADYEVSFKGSAGAWSARFTLGCVSLVNSPYVEVEDTGCDLLDF
jgi:hypothetical protein